MLKKIFFCCFIFYSFTSFADCNSAPAVPYNAAGYSTYASWCRSCGGTPSNVSGMSCNPGPHWNSAASSQGTSSNLRPEQQIILNVGSNLLRGLIQDFFSDDPAQELARRQRAEQLRREAIERERLRQELERQKKEASYQKLSKELKDLPSDSNKLNVKDANDTQLSLKLDDDENTPLLPKTECTEAQAKLNEMENHGIKIFDEQIKKIQAIIDEAKQAREKSKTANAELAGEFVANIVADRVKDFTVNVRTIRQLKVELTSIPLDPKETLKLKKWIENGITTGNGVIDATEKAKAANAFNFSDPDPKINKRKQMLIALSEFNGKFMADTGAWELAGETLSNGLGPAGPFAFKTAVLGIKSAANFGSMKLDEAEINEQKYHLGNMIKMKTELAQKITNLKKELQEKCK